MQNYRESILSGLRGHFHDLGVAQGNLGEGVGTVLYLGCGGGYTTLRMCQNSEL